jgi:hypothetical protein
MEARRKNRSPKIQMPLLHTQCHKDERGKREGGRGGRARGSERGRERGREREAGRHWHVHIHTRCLDDPAEIEHLVALLFQKLHGHV